jgi:ferredoxin
LPLEIEIDRNRCRGVGECARRAPNTFSVADGGKAIASPSDRDAEEVVVVAARACPHFAIAVIRDGKRMA